MDWLPQLPDASRAIKAVKFCGAPAEQLSALIKLANHRLNYLETIQTDRALRKLEVMETGDLRHLKVALVGSATLDHLIPGIRVAGLRHGFLLNVQSGAYGQYRQDIFNPSSSLHAFSPEIVVLSLNARELLGQVPVGASISEVTARIDDALGDVRGWWSALRNRHNCKIVQQTCLNSEPALFGSYDHQTPSSPTRVVSVLNERLADTAAQDSVLLLDIDWWRGREGINAWYDVTRWLQAKQEIAPQASPFYGELLVRLLAAQIGRSRKCLVLDLDNTLWGGVLGDDGLDGIILGQGSASGEAHLALQQYVLALKQRGILLAICSKNNHSTAERAFREHREMALRMPDVAAFLANWEDKASNVQAIAKKLNIGLDSLVFVDDNPAERARIRDALPMVAVPEMPEDPSLYVRVLSEAGYFEAVGLTQEDLQRSDQYKANAERDALRAASSSMEVFLAGLNMSVFHGPFTSQDLPRVFQLINRTNQFRVTLARYSLDEVCEIAGDVNIITLQFRLVDRLGDNGLVSVMIIKSVEKEPCVFSIDSWVMSCRVFGRELEYEAMNIAVDTIRGRGGKIVRAQYTPTEKNSIVADLYPRLGFSPVPSDNPDGATSWVLKIAEYEGRQTKINREQFYD